MQNYDTLNTLSVTQAEESKLSLDKASPEDIPHLEQKLMSLPELTPKKSSCKKMTHSAITYYSTYIATQMKTTSQMPWAFYTKES